MKRRIFISTGEVSGDLQGSLLIAALQRHLQSQQSQSQQSQSQASPSDRVLAHNSELAPEQKSEPALDQAPNQAPDQALEKPAEPTSNNPIAPNLDLDIVALGGDRMAAAGATLVGNTTGLGSVGLLEALSYIWPSWRIQQRAKAYLKENPPDLVILIDYMGPNLTLGRFLRRSIPQVPILYYIAPQEWVWSFGKSRSSAIADLPNEILAIFPAEAQYYQNLGATVRWMGHPLIDAIDPPQADDRAAARAQLGIAPDQTTIVLLPASRTQELQYLLPVMLEAAQILQTQLPKAQFWIPVSQPAFVEPLTTALKAAGLTAQLWQGDNAQLFTAADLAITKSGTVNLELALYQVPQVVIYRISAFSAWILRHVLRFSIPFASPPNLILNREIVPELLQDAATSDRIAQAALTLLQDPQRRHQVLTDYQTLRSTLGEPGVCDRVAQAVWDYLVPDDNGSIEMP
ncbi:MAG: lipid-A-disaccharide synthase [Prochlorothrix sp.]|nr:lipid-A-disaccharide synthase [Prochlorothrix sp.]